MKIYDILVEFKKGIKAVKHNKKAKDPAKQFEKAKEKLAPVKPMEEAKEDVAEAAKKPNATTRHLRDYPVSDKDVAKPVKKPEKNKPEQGVAEGKSSIMGTLMNEGGWGRDSWDSNMPGWQQREQDAWDQDKRDFKRREMEHELGDEEEYYQRQVAKQRELDRGPWYIRINGKLLRSKGEVKVFDWKKGANNYALAILKNKPELQGKIMLTKRAEDETTENIRETASPGATSAGNVATLGMNPKLSPGPARGKKSYTGSPGKSGTKAPPQPKVIQPKGKGGTAKNALDMKSNIFGGGAVKRK